jgi:ABC-type multidrug transport system ATPase subunit
VFIKHGQVIGSRDLHNAPEGEIQVHVRGNNLRQELLPGLSQWTTSAQLQSDRLSLSTKSMDALPEILRYLVAANVDVFEFTPEKLSLEESFLKLMGEDQGL